MSWVTVVDNRVVYTRLYVTWVLAVFT